MNTNNPYRTPFWHYGLFLLILFGAIAWPSFYLSHHSNHLNWLYKLYIIQPLILLFYLITIYKNKFTKKIDHQMLIRLEAEPKTELETDIKTKLKPTNKVKSLIKLIIILTIKPLSLIILIQLFLGLLCYLSVHSLLLLDTQKNQLISMTHHSVINTLILWLGTWSFFALYTVLSYYYYYSEHNLPLLSTSLYRFKHNLFNTAIKRTVNYIHLAASMVFIYWSMTFLIINSLSLLLGPLTLSNYSAMIFILFSSTIFASIINKSWIKKQGNKLKWPGSYFILIAVLINIISFYLLVKLPIHLPTNSQALLSKSVINLGIDPIIIPLFICSLIILATPLCSSLIVKYSELISVRKLIAYLIIMPILVSIVMLVNHSTINTLNLSIPRQGILITSIVLQLIFILIFTNKTDTSGYITGKLILKQRQRIVIGAANYQLFATFIFLPSLIIFSIVTSGLNYMAIYTIVIGTLILITSLASYGASYGRWLRRIKQII